MTYQTHPAPTPHRNTWKVILIIAAILVALCGGGAIACTALVGKAASDVDRQIKTEQVAKQDGVKITKCNTTKAADDIFPHVEVELEIVNTTADQQSYFLDLFVKDAKGVRLANGSAMVTDVRPGQKVNQAENVALTKALKTGAKVTCSIDKVS